MKEDINAQITSGEDYLEYLRSFKDGEIKTPSYGGLSAYVAEEFLNTLAETNKVVGFYGIDHDSERLLVNVMLQKTDNASLQLVTYRMLPKVSEEKLHNFKDMSAIILSNSIFIEED